MNLLHKYNQQEYIKSPTSKYFISLNYFHN